MDRRKEFVLGAKPGVLKGVGSIDKKVWKQYQTHLSRTTPLERAEFYAREMKERRMRSFRALSLLLGEPINRVGRYIKLVELPEPIKAFLRQHREPQYLRYFTERQLQELVHLGDSPPCAAAGHESRNGLGWLRVRCRHQTAAVRPSRMRGTCEGSVKNDADNRLRAGSVRGPTKWARATGPSPPSSSPNPKETGPPSRGLHPKWVLTDRGSQFTSGRFRRTVARLGARRRFARLGESNLSKLDRHWRTMKEEFGRSLFLWRPLGSIRKELLRYASWHARERPHEGLGLRTPDEVYYRHRPERPMRVESGVLVVRRLGGDARLPVFRLQAA